MLCKFQLHALKLRGHQYFHIFTCILYHQRVYCELKTWSALRWLESSLGKALHRYCRGHGFENQINIDMTLQSRWRLVTQEDIFMRNLQSSLAEQLRTSTRDFNTLPPSKASCKCSNVFQNSCKVWGTCERTSCHYVLCKKYNLTARAC